MRKLFPILLFVSSLGAQQPVAPTTEKIGPVRGEEAGNYNVVQSWETGYRFAEVGGNRGQYRSDVNYGNGIRLLGSSLTVNSKDGHGRFFDEVILTTQGLGNDPYESVVLRAQKNRIYHYDFSWRQNNYYNPGLVVASGEHFQDTAHRWQDHDLVLFPQGRYRLRLGYSRNWQTGPALTSQQFFNASGVAEPLFANVRREFNEYRLGGEVEFHRVHFNVLRRWEFYKEDTPYSLYSGTLFGGSTLAPTGDLTTLSSFGKAEPIRGYTPGWLFNVYTENRWFAVNGRFTYAGGQRNFVVDESSIGIDRFGSNQNRQVFVSGNAQRPVTTGDASISVFPTSKLTLVNNSSFSNIRINGDSQLEQFDLATLSNQVLDFQFLGIRLFTNSTDARYQFTRKFSAYTGYHFATRQIRSIQSETIPDVPFENTLYSQTNHLHAAVAGFNWNPIAPLRIHAEAELGRNDNPFTIVSERNYHAISGRAQYRWKSIQLSAAYRQNYNNNSVTLTSYSSRSRNYTASGSWTPRSWFTVDATYSRLHLDTLGGLAFFAGTPFSQLVTNQQSVYVSNIHAATLVTRFALHSRADLFLGYSITRDTGNDNPGTLTTTTDPVTALLYSVQQFPLSFQSPSARISVKLQEKIRLNFGYQYYGYKEDFGLFSLRQNYRANTGFTSVLWSF